MSNFLKLYVQPKGVEKIHINWLYTGLKKGLRVTMFEHLPVMQYVQNKNALQN